jgi:peptide/nickel transport system ATP-binding protein
MLQVRNLDIDWHAPHGTQAMVRQVGFSLETGSSLTIIGETGCGKTLVAQSILGLLPPKLKAKGQVVWDGRDLLKMEPRSLRMLWGREMFLFPQEPLEALNPCLRALSQVREVFKWVFSVNGDSPAKHARALMESLDLEPQSERLYPCQMSGGMRQRLAAAITLAEPARLIVADEPSKGLDPLHRGQVVKLLRGICAKGKALLTITHDLEVVRGLGGDVAVMYGGRILETGQSQEVLANPRHPYTQALLASSPKAGLKPIPWRLHDRPINGGCVFATRCIKARDRCFLHQPPPMTPDCKASCHAA